jgi:hypothetical protein
MKAENILKKANVPILLIPAPKALMTDCGLALKFDVAHLDQIMATLQADQLLPATVYRKESDIRYTLVWSSNSDDNSDS